jgi:hypothetical protein
MRRATAWLTIPALAASLALGGCENFDPESWFSTKKPLPGERKSVFPGGVPGVPQGVPPELVKGYQPPVEPEPPPPPRARQRATPARPVPTQASPAPQSTQASPVQQRWPEPPPGSAQQRQQQSQPPQQSQQQQQARWPEPPPGAPSR